MTQHKHRWSNTNEFQGGRLSETCECGAYSTIEFPPDTPPSRNIWPESAHQGIAGFTQREALTDDEKKHYRDILGL